MYATANKKMLNMLILEILENYTDENRRLTQLEIVDILRRDYGMECDRRAVRRNIDSLRDMDYLITYEGGYYKSIFQL